MATIRIRNGENIQAKIGEAKAGDTVQFDNLKVDRAINCSGRNGIIYTGVVTKIASPSSVADPAFKYRTIQMENTSDCRLDNLRLEGGGMGLYNVTRLLAEELHIDGAQGDDDWRSASIAYDGLQASTFKRFSFRKTRTAPSGKGLANAVYGFHGADVKFQQGVVDDCFEGFHMMRNHDNLIEDVEITNFSRIGIEWQRGYKDMPAGTLRRVYLHSPKYDIRPNADNQRWFPISMATPESSSCLMEEVAVTNVVPSPTINGRRLAGWIIEAFCPGKIIGCHLVSPGDLGIAVCEPVEIDGCRIYVNGPAIQVQKYYAGWRDEFGRDNDPRIISEKNVVSGTWSTARALEVINPIKGSPTTPPVTPPVEPPVEPPPPRPVLKVTVNDDGTLLVDHEETGKTLPVTVRTTRRTEQFQVPHGGLTIGPLISGWEYWAKSPGYDEIGVMIPGKSPAGVGIDDFYAPETPSVPVDPPVEPPVEPVEPDPMILQLQKENARLNKLVADQEEAIKQQDNLNMLLQGAVDTVYKAVKDVQSTDVDGV